MSAKTYIIANGVQPTIAAFVKQPTGTAIRTMLQIRPATGYNPRLIEWGCSFDASAAAVPGQVEVFETTAAATLTTAHGVGDIMIWGQPGSTPANTAGATGEPFNLSTATTAFASAAGTEGTVAAYRMADLQLLPPTGPYVKQFPLSREFELTAQNYLRVRVTFGATVNMYIYTIWEI